MTNDRADIIVVGGGSRVGEALLGLLDREARTFSRRATRAADETIVTDYANITESEFAGATTVVNCVGISKGDAQLMQRVNVTLPILLAQSAKAAGAQQFIHISSFSVYGHEAAITRDVPPAPNSLYGHSKYQADQDLLALADTHFRVTILRLPLVYAPGSLGKLGQLIGLWRKFRVFPVPSGDVERAMISVNLSAAVVARLIVAPQPGIRFAADPRPFTYRDTAQALGGGLMRLPLPRVATGALRKLAPALGHRLFSNSTLDAADNLAIEFGLASGLYNDIASASIHLKRAAS